MSAGADRFLADATVAVGGMGLGPNPYDLLVAGLGACTSMTLRLYAERTGRPKWRRMRSAEKHSSAGSYDCKS